MQEVYGGMLLRLTPAGVKVAGLSGQWVRELLHCHVYSKGLCRDLGGWEGP